VNETDNKSRFGRPRGALAILALILIAAVCLNLLWLHTHHIPVYAGHGTMLSGIHAFRLLLEDPLRGIGKFLCLKDYNLYQVSSVLVASLFGLSYRSMVFTSTIYYLLLIIFAYDTARMLGNRLGGLAAAVSIMLFPAVFGWSRIYCTFIAGMFFPLLGFWLLLSSRAFTKAAPTMAFALLCALSMRLGETVSENIMTLFVLFFPAAYFFIFQMIRGRTKHRRILALSLSAAALFVIVLLTDYRYIYMAIGYLNFEAIDQRAIKYTPGNIAADPSAIWAYFLIMWHENLSPPFAILTLAALGITAWRPTARQGALLIYFLVPLVLLSLIAKKNYNYIFALLPTCAVLIGVAVAKVARGRWGGVATAAIAVIGSFTFVNLSFMYQPNPTELFGAPTDYRRYFQSWEVPVHMPFAASSALMTIAELAAEKSASSHGASILIMAPYTSTDAEMLHFLLELKNKGGSLRVYFPVFDISLHIVEGFDRPAPPENFQPDMIINFSILEVLQKQRADGIIMQMFEGYQYLLDYPYDVKTLDQLVRRWAVSLDSIPWDLYVHDRISIISQPFFTVTHFDLLVKNVDDSHKPLLNLINGGAVH